jgi:hypothetical protein
MLGVGTVCGASIAHVNPRTVRGGFAHAVSTIEAAYGAAVRIFQLKATAAFAASMQKSPLHAGAGISADANAVKDFSGRVVADDGEPTKNCANLDDALHNTTRYSNISSTSRLTTHG